MAFTPGTHEIRTDCFGRLNLWQLLPTETLNLPPSYGEYTWIITGIYNSKEELNGDMARQTEISARHDRELAARRRLAESAVPARRPNSRRGRGMDQKRTERLQRFYLSVPRRAQ